MKVLVLKTIGSDFSAYGNFIWPESGRVVCPDWNPEPVCGFGLHGLLWGEGDSRLLIHSLKAKWLVLEVDSEKIVDLSGKVKFPECNVLYAGARDVAVGMILEKNPGAACIYAKKIAGDEGTVFVGDYGEAIAGYYGTALAKYRGKATVGDGGTVIAGRYGMAIAGHSGTATAGNGGTAKVGKYGKATAGNGGTAIAGEYGKAIAGEYGKATAGDCGIAIAGFGGKVSVGVGGTIEIEYWQEKRYKKIIGYEGKDIKAHKFYKFKGKNFVEVKD